jgi:hypothetical protein
MPKTIVFAATDCVVNFDGYPVRLRTNDLWEAADPLVLARPDLFSDEPDARLALRTTSRPVDVEDAMAVPGRRRRAR